MQNALMPAARVVLGALGGLAAYLEPTFPFGLVCTLAILLDCVSAYMLCRRVRLRRYKDTPSAAAYFTSRKMGRVFTTMLRVYALIVLAFLVDNYIFTFVEMYLANIVAGAFCFCQIWSILENESSENDAKWAKVLQKIMVDKASRHLDVDLSDLTTADSTTDSEKNAVLRSDDKATPTADETAAPKNRKEADHETDH